MVNDVWLVLASGGVFVAIIEGVKEYLSWRRNRKAVKEDRAEERAEEQKIDYQEKQGKKIKNLEEKVDALVEAQKFIMYDRIRYLGQAYIDAKEIDFDDRRILHQMHESYHYGLDGNGDLDALMDEINHLPLKHRGDNL